MNNLQISLSVWVSYQAWEFGFGRTFLITLGFQTRSDLGIADVKG